ncbi:MAG TPA: heparinase II/III family protein, partial [Armatimonadota bacterium]|nr:heparinase II/III family protein [Armatimonadota bacterium]
GQPLEFGYGDTPHQHNQVPSWQLYTHMANIRHLYGTQLPDAAALGRHLQEIVPESQQRYSSTWFIYPFLLADAESAPPALAPDSLPHARHFDNMGQIFMRSGSGPDDTYSLFTVGGILAQHKHFDALNFVIYRGGHLALDSGTRYKEAENGQHLCNYYAQTVAHNCVIIHQPGEPPANYWGGSVEGCHGGQHKQLGSVVEAFETNDQFVYVAGDATECYKHGDADLGEKASLVTRQYVFLMPNHFVVFDRVSTTKPEYKKDWLLHTAYEPVIDGDVVRADHSGGRMFCRTLLPESATLTPVGGPGNEFLAAGENWDIDSGDLKPEALAMMGQWRVEVSPTEASADDLFLHVIQVGDESLDAMDATELIRDGDGAGVKLTSGEREWTVMFATAGDLSGSVSLTDGGNEVLARDFATDVTPQVGILASAE